MKAKMLFVGDSPTIICSGQSTVARALCSRLNNYYNLRVAGWGYNGEKHNLPYFIYPTTYTWWEAIADFKPDILFLSHDVWRFQQLIEVRKAYPEMKIIGYFTIDGEPLPKPWMPVMDCCDVIISPSLYGQKVIEERWATGPVLVVPQGVENNFFMTVQKAQAKQSMDMETYELAKKQSKEPIYYSDKFVVYFGGVNQTKKNIGSILDGFTKFAADKKDVILNLLLHSHVFDVYGMKTVGDYDINDFYSWAGYTDKIFLVDSVLTENRLIKFYSVADVLISPSIGEGFGLFVVEAMASRVIPIISNFSAFTEWPDPNAVFLMDVDAFYRVHWNVKRSIVDADTVAYNLERAYRVWKISPKRWQIMQDLNQTRARLFTWDNCVKSLLSIFDLVLKGEDFISLSVKRLK